MGTLHPVYQLTCQPWISFMANLGKCYRGIFYIIRKYAIKRSAYSKDERFYSFLKSGFLVFHLTGCPSIQQCKAEITSQFLLPSILTEIVNLVTSLASDTTVKAFEMKRWVVVLGMRWLILFPFCDAEVMCPLTNTAEKLTLTAVRQGFNNLRSCKSCF